MGIFDHRKTWSFDVSASPEACIDAFVAAMTDKSALRLMATSWSVTRGRSADGLPTAVATYEGRAGLAGALTVLSSRATAEKDAAVGSRLSFKVVSIDAARGRTRCAMAMTQVASVYFFFIADARFFRSAMNHVGRCLSRVDQSLLLQKA